MNTCSKTWLFLILASAIVLNGCKKDSPVEGESSANLSSFELIQRTVFDLSCATSGCHTQTSRAGGLVLERNLSYENLINVLPSNTAARGDGLRLVRPGQPDSSFLMIKLDRPASTQYGDPMPQNLLSPLTENFRLFIRQWIAAGAPRTGKVADEQLLTASSGNEEPFTPLPPPAQGIQIHLPPFTIIPGNEREVFYFTRLTNFDTLYVSRIEIKMRSGSHHFILYKYSQNDLPENQFRNLDRNSVVGEMYLRYNYRQFFTGSQSPHLNYQLPDNVVIHLAPQQGIDLNSHYVNAGLSPATGEVYINLHTTARTESTKIAQVLFDNHFSFTLPPQDTTTLLYTTTYANPRTVLTLSSHTHKRGQSFKIFLVGGPNNGQLVYENYSWDHPAITTYTPPLYFESGWGYRLEATYVNETTRPIGFGFSSEDEMCIAFGYYYE